MIVDFRMRVPFREKDTDPSLTVPTFMRQYKVLLGYEEKINVTTRELIESLEKSGIDFAVLQAEYEFGEYAEALNERAARICEQFPGRFVAFATVDLSSVMGAVRQFRYAVEELGLKGLNLQPGFWHMDPTDRRLYPLYAMGVDYGVPVTIHTGINYALRPLRHELPLHIDEIACDFPDLRIVASHAGWPWVAEMVAVARRHPNVFLELGGIAPRYIGMPRVGWDPLFHFANSLLQDQVLFATDWPIMSQERALGEIKSLPWKPEVLAKVLGGNAMRLLGLNMPRQKGSGSGQG